MPADPEFFVLKLLRVVRIDPDQEHLRQQNLCPTCHRYWDVVGGRDRVVDGTAPFTGLLRSDLTFASGNEQGPLVLAGEDAVEAFRVGRIRGLHLEPIEANPS